MDRLVSVSKKADIFPEYRNTPVERLLEYNNMKRPYEDYSYAEILIAECMDYRENLHIPDKFAYIIRTAGANLQFCEFGVSYAIAVAQINHIAIIGHDNCAMVNIYKRKDIFIEGLVSRAGWNKKAAEDHFNKYEKVFEISSEVDFVLYETKLLRSKYPGIVIVPMMYLLEDNNIYLINEE